MLFIYTVLMISSLSRLLIWEINLAATIQRLNGLGRKTVVLTIATTKHLFRIDTIATEEVYRNSPDEKSQEEIWKNHTQLADMTQRSS